MTNQQIKSRLEGMQSKFDDLGSIDFEGDMLDED